MMSKFHKPVNCPARRLLRAAICSASFSHPPLAVSGDHLAVPVNHKRLATLKAENIRIWDLSLVGERPINKLTFDFRVESAVDAIILRMESIQQLRMIWPQCVQCVWILAMALVV